jgi:hypothetical protein
MSMEILMQVNIKLDCADFLRRRASQPGLVATYYGVARRIIVHFIFVLFLHKNS